MEGNPKFDASQDLPDIPYARWADRLGLTGIRIDAPDNVGAAWDEALASGRPVVLEALTDPNVPPLPPHITLEQARAMLLAFVKQDPDRGAVVRQTLRDKARELLPGG